ncbi:type II secretion system protein [Deinococcus arenicola]|uniref:Type II secretion system protein n=1 Tax=Deinococcus arenicola TaxID=2994950 RepID=A0ABU4DQB6_9DEIO|nr:type II secretion system protein [Deinococcus sp. ZS9-10]MDV6374595.1 type II secretion system protein [Deinococcus sp. ZS9-10]
MNKDQRFLLQRAGHSASTRRAQGFTLIEILVSIAILGILAAVLTTTLTGTLSLNRQSQRQLDTTARAQQLLESVRGAWALAPTAGASLSDFYDRACVPSATVALNGLSAQYINLDSRAQPFTSSAANITLAANCAVVAAVQMGSGTTATPYPMRRLIVSSGTGQQDVTLTLDVLRPR